MTTESRLFRDLARREECARKSRAANAARLLRNFGGSEPLPVIDRPSAVFWIFAALAMCGAVIAWVAA